MRNFRLGEWLPEPMTPLFADWLLPLHRGRLPRRHAGQRRRGVPFRYAAVNGWYYNATPAPDAATAGPACSAGPGPDVKSSTTRCRVTRDPAAADRAVLGQLYRRWRDVELPPYQQLVDTGCGGTRRRHDG